MSEWQPIDSAPRDGTRLLLAEGRLFSAGSWCSFMGGEPRWWTDNPVAFAEPDEQHANYDFAFDEYVKHPTHWMPLPTPPESAK